MLRPMFIINIASPKLKLIKVFYLSKVDMLTEIAHPPKIMTNVSLMIQPEQFKKDLDSYLKTRSPATFPSDLRSKLQVINKNKMSNRCMMLIYYIFHNFILMKLLFAHINLGKFIWIFGFLLLHRNMSQSILILYFTFIILFNRRCR